MLQRASRDETVSLLSDRRSNPFIRTRQRATFERRDAYRVGVQGLAFVRCGDEHVNGTLKNISDTGACLELPNENRAGDVAMRLGIPLMHEKTISCTTTWSRDIPGNGHYHCGVRFVGLTQDEKLFLRKRILLNEGIMLDHAEKIAGKVADEQKRRSIITFFLVDVRMALEHLIDIDAALAESSSQNEATLLCKQILDRLTEAGDELDTALGEVAVIKDVKSRVRTLLGQFLYQSKVMKRAVEKPRGYPGDYKMLEMAYNNTELSSGIGSHLDRFALDRPYSEAIRMRKDMMKEILYSFINTSASHNLKILNLASGACREIREMLQRPLKHRGRVDLTCIDQDEEAIAYSQEQLSQLENSAIAVNFIRGNILRLDELDIGPDDSLDMVYSIGIADYLQDRMLTKIFQDSYKKLKPGGKLVVAYKDKDKNKPLAFNWYVDWNFIPRNEDELTALVQKALPAQRYAMNITREPTGIIFFAEITKAG